MNQLKHTDKLFKALIENSWDVTILIDEKARVLYASPSSVRMFGRDYKDFMGINGFKFLHPLDAPKVVKALSQILLKPQHPIQMEMRIKHKDGHYVWIEAIATNLLADKDVNGIVVNYHDITALKKIDELKDEFISIASHELRSPITSLKVYLQLLTNKKDTITATKKDEFFKKMSQQIDRLERFVNDIYEATKIREGKISLEKEKFTLRLLLKETIDDLERNYTSHKIVLLSKFNGYVIADRMRIQQVLLNIIINAIKFSPQANKIAVKIWKKDKNVFVSVTDYGAGIAKEDISKITERFYQAGKNNKSTAGLGLGLYIAHNIIKQHQGDFLLASKLGKSTTITFYIPQK